MTSPQAHRESGPGALVLVATPIGNLGDLSPRAVEVLRTADAVWCEDTRRTRTLLTHAGVSGVALRSVQQHNEAAAAQELVGLVARGATVAYASDAGMPGVSDPGARLVAACAAADLTVSVVPGPSAGLAALVISGLPTDRFVFEGFLERKGPARRAALARIAAADCTSVLYEAPTRLGATLAELAAAAGPQRPAAVVRELTKMHEEVCRGVLGALAESAADGTLTARGECVVVVGAAVADAAPLGADDLAAMADAVLAEGLRTRDAADVLAARSGLARREAYDLLLERDRLRGRR